VIAGNHDITLDEELWIKDADTLKRVFKNLKDIEDPGYLKEIVRKACTHYLQDSGVEVHGYKVWGSPW
jgi:hypothetical protein